MIAVDYRAGSKELVQPLIDRGLDVVETTLEFGDLSFVGRGENDTEVMVGVEYKRLNDLLGSMRTGRLEGHQLLGMREQPPLYDFAYLLIEGMPLIEGGKLMERYYRQGRPATRPMKGTFTAAELFKRLHVLQLRGGLTPIWSTSLETTVLQIEMLYRVWTDKPLDAHDSHIAIYNAPTLTPVSQMRQTLNTLPGLGLAKSSAAQQRFRSIRRAVNATAAEWAALEIPDKSGKSKRLGVSAAERIVNAITEEH